MRKNKRIIIAGGGTGGHIFPAIAIANALVKADETVEILFVGASGKMEMQRVPQAGYKIEGLTIAGFNRSSLIRNISLPFKLVKSFFEVAGIFKRFVPDAVVGVGGYSSFPVLKYAQAKGIPTFIHESNSFAGKSNIMLGKRATRIFTATDGMEKFFPASVIQVTGNPVRQAIIRGMVTPEAGRSYFNLQPHKKTVLCIGGSLGAKNINEAVAANLSEFAKNGLQIIWQTGKPFHQQALKAAEKYDNVFVTDFISEMENAYAAADVVISRSGAMAIAELCVVKKPVVFVPFPYAAEDHQTANARKLVEKDAAIMIKDADAPAKLVDEIISLAANHERQQLLINNIGKLRITDADTVIAHKILEYIKS